LFFFFLSFCRPLNRPRVLAAGFPSRQIRARHVLFKFLCREHITLPYRACTGRGVLIRFEALNIKGCSAKRAGRTGGEHRVSANNNNSAGDATRRHSRR
jgi:hypothetical protein